MTRDDEALSDLVRIMARLRNPDDGCKWDVAQDFASIAPYTIEEAYEVADAIERRDFAALQEELGDLLLQIVFHARMAEEAGYFAIADVCASICNKMVRRHPHLFDDDAPRAAADVDQRWEEIKMVERGDAGALDGVALALPALMRAQKVQKRAAHVGFDWPDAQGAKAKITEELAEAEAASAPADVEEEVGDLLFAVVNYARHRGVDTEQALRGATAKFEGRFRFMESRSANGFVGLSDQALDDLWNVAKAAQSSSDA